MRSINRRFTYLLTYISLSPSARGESSKIDVERYECWLQITEVLHRQQNSCGKPIINVIGHGLVEFY